MSAQAAQAEAAPRRARAAIGYRDLEEEGGSARREDSLQRTVTDLNKDSELATQVEIQRTKSAGLLNDPNLWREGRPEA